MALRCGRLPKAALAAAAVLMAVESPAPAAPSDAPAVRVKRVVYRNAGNLELYIDLYLPADLDPGRSKRPTFVWIHGGGWRLGSPKQGKRFSQYFAERGLVGACVRYRLATEAKFPACLTDAKCAVRFLRANAGQYGIDPSRIAVGGSSAGGHLSAMAGLTPGEFEGDGCCQEQSSKPDLLFLLSAIFDCRPARLDGPVQILLGEQSPTEEERYAISPIAHVSENAPPTLIVHGDEDSTAPYKYAVAFRDALEKHGVEVEMLTAKGKKHSYFYHDRRDLEAVRDRIEESLKAKGFWPDE